LCIFIYLVCYVGLLFVVCIVVDLGLFCLIMYYLFMVLVDVGFVVYLFEECCFGLGVIVFEVGLVYMY